MQFWSLPRRIAIVMALLAWPIAAPAQSGSSVSVPRLTKAERGDLAPDQVLPTTAPVPFVPDWDSLAPGRQEQPDHADPKDETENVDRTDQAGHTAQAGHTDQADRTDRAGQPAREDGAEAAGATAVSARLRFNFRFQPWSDVLNWFADQAGYSLVLDVAPTGTFNYSDAREYTPSEAIDLLNSVLMTKGYTLVLRDRMLLLVNLEDPIPPSLVSEVPAEQLEERGVFELLSTRFQLRNLSVDDAQDEIEELLGPQGSMIPLPKARQLVVVELGGRLRTIRDVLEKAEKARDPAQHEMKWFDLHSVATEEVVALLRQMFEIPEGGNAMPDGSLRFATDPAGLRLLAAGRPDRLEQVAKMLAMIDPAGFADGGHVGPQAALQIEVYTLAPADPESVFRVMQTLLADSPGARLALDPKTNNLIAMARPAEHATIRATVEQLRNDAQDVEVIRLRVVDPHLAALAINKLFAEDGGKAPSIDADLSSRQLLIRGSIGQIVQIRSLLAKMGEPLRSDGGLSGGKLRRVPVDAADAAELIDRLQQLWPSLNPNDLRVVPTGRAGGSRLIDERTPVPGPPTTTDPPRGRGPVFGSGPPPRMGARTEGPTGPIILGQDVVADPTLRDPLAPQPIEKPPGNPPSGEWPVTSVPLEELPPSDAVSEPTFSPPIGSTDEASSPAVPAGSPPATERSFRSTETDSPSARPAIFAIPGPDGLFISSEDTEALDQLESLIDALSGRTSYDASRLTVFYLRHTQAASAAERLNQLLAGAAVAGAGAAAQPAGNAAQVAGILGTLGAINSAGRITPSGPISITPDSRLNALLVQALPADVKLIEQLLTILDRPGSPEEVAAESKPRLIPVLHTTASEIAEVVKEVYQDRLTTASGRGAAAQQMMMQMFRRGREGGGGPGGMQGAQGMPGMPGMQGMQGMQGLAAMMGGQSTEPQAKMSIGVDARTNSVIVSAPEALFEEVRNLVEALDQAASEENQTVQVLSLRNSNPETIRAALGTILGDSVQYSSSTTRGGSRTGARTGAGTGAWSGMTGNRGTMQSPFGTGGMGSGFQRTGQGGRR